MKRVKRECEKCHQALEWENVCDCCGKTIIDEVFHYYLIVKRTDPESDEQHTFEFCGYKHMVMWMNKRKVHTYRGEVCGTTPYTWEQESRKKFKCTCTNVADKEK